VPIEFSCGSCGKRIKAPDNLAGKRARCPQCQTAVEVPGGGIPPAPIQAAPQPAGSPFHFDEPDPQADPDARRPCPACGEPILVSAIKCRFCGEIFDRVLRERYDPRVKADFDRQINGLGCLWTFFGVLCVALVVLAISVMEGELDVASEELMVIGVIASAWLLAGIGSFMKQVWAVWVGLVMSYLSVLVQVATMGGGRAGGGCIDLGIMLIGIWQAHKVLGIAKRMR
jgi:hypothetical protein